MEKRAKYPGFLIVIVFLFVFSSTVYSQPDNLTSADELAGGSSADAASPDSQKEAFLPAQPDVASAQSANQISVDFKDADIRNVLGIISLKSGTNIVASPEVVGAVTVRLVDVPWEDALRTIVGMYGYGYDKRGNVVMVAPLAKLTDQKKMEAELYQVQPTLTEVFNLKFIDSADARKAIEPQLSPRGRITALQSTGQAGWEFGTSSASGLGKRKRSADSSVSRSKTLVITDIQPVLDRIRKVISEIDIKPEQILIETRIIEANKDRLRDIGIDWGTGTTGAEASTLLYTPTGKSSSGDTSQIGGHLMSDGVTPSSFTPKLGTSLTTINTGLRVAFRKLTGAQFEAVLHALEEDVTANTLSAPRIMTLNNQEATILVGQKYPLVKTDISTESGKITGSTLDKYEDIGIQLNVVPQISGKEHINMIVHPAVTSYSSTLKVKTESGVILSEFPIIDTREAETQILIKDGETIVIGGLLKDVRSLSKIGIPFLGKLPLVGFLFQRHTNDTEKIDLLIFITAHVVKEGEFSDAYIATLEESLNTVEPKKVKKSKPPKNK